MADVDTIPILELDGVLIVSVQTDLHDAAALDLLDRLTQRIVASGAHGVVVEISSLDFVDSFMGRVLHDIAATAAVLDTTTVVVGMRPSVAITLVDLGLELEGVRTALNLKAGMEIVSTARKERSGGTGRTG